MTGYVAEPTRVERLCNVYKNETGSERFIVSMVMTACLYLPPPD